MTSERRSDDPQEKGRTLQEEIGRIATRKPPPPQNKGIVMVVLAVVVVVAAVWQLATGGGAAQAIRENHPRQPKALRSAEPDPGQATPGQAPSPARPSPANLPPTNDGRVTATARSHVALPIAPPGSDIALPAGIGAATAADLRPALSALRPPRVGAGAGEREIHRRITEDALRNLARLVRSSDEGERDLVRAVVLDALAPLVAQERLGTAALEAAIEIVGSDPVGARAVIDAARGPGLASDETATTALVFLGRLGGDHADTEAVLKTLVKDTKRPVRVRLLALDRLVAWDTALDDDPALREAIESLPR